MQKLYYLIITILFINVSNAQIFNGTVSTYDKGPYNMGENENWNRIAINGGLDFNRKAYVSFKDKSITFVIGSNSNEKEVYIHSELHLGGSKKYTVFSDIPYYTFALKESDYQIHFFNSKNFNSGKSLFVVTIYSSRIMYFFECDENIDDLVNNLYK
jgi:hypothetical protein